MTNTTLGKPQSTVSILEIPSCVPLRCFPLPPARGNYHPDFHVSYSFFLYGFTKYVYILKTYCLVFIFLNFIWMEYAFILRDYFSSTVCNFPSESSYQPWLVRLSGLSATLWTKGRWFDSWSGHMPGLQAMSPVWGMQEATNCFSRTSMFLSLSFSSLPLVLKIKHFFKSSYQRKALFRYDPAIP